MLRNRTLLLSILKLQSKAFSALPRRISINFGKMIGLIMYFIIPLRKKVALINLKIAFPNLSKTDINLILKKCYTHFGILASEFLRIPKLNKYNINEIIPLDSETKKILNNNEPVIIMTGHIGNWEMILPLLGYNNYYTSGVAQIQKNKTGENFFNWIRNCDNTELISKKDSINTMNQALDNKKNLILASDQSAGDKGAISVFFNTPTSTPKGAAIFHLKKKIPIITLFVIMDANYNYIINSKLLKFNFNTEKKDEKIHIINQLYNKELENIIIKNPEQYFWFHRKWDKEKYK